MSDTLYQRLLVKYEGDAAKVKRALSRICALLLNNTQGWWYHHQLREAGEHEQARRLEMASVRGSVKTLASAVYALASARGSRWVIHLRAERHPFPYDAGAVRRTLLGWLGDDGPSEISADPGCSIP